MILLDLDGDEEFAPPVPKETTQLSQPVQVEIGGVLVAMRMETLSHKVVVPVGQGEEVCDFWEVAPLGGADLDRVVHHDYSMYALLLLSSEGAAFGSRHQPRIGEPDMGGKEEDKGHWNFTWQALVSQCDRI